MDLTFAQSFQASIAGRYTRASSATAGPPTGTSPPSTDSNGDAVIYERRRLTFYYTLQPDGSYTDEPGDHSVADLSQRRLPLVEPDGTVYQFNPNGTLAYVQDANGNRITAGYNAAGQLVSLTDSNGEYLTLTYNAHGHLATLTDSNGQTETYGYDSTGQFLTSYTGRIRHHDLHLRHRSVTAAEQRPGRDRLRRRHHIYFTYDSEGRLDRPAPQRRGRGRDVHLPQPRRLHRHRRRRQHDHHLLQPLRRHRRDDRSARQRDAITSTTATRT